MVVITTALLLLIAVVISVWVTRALPFGMPIPIIQILIGVGIALWTDYETKLDPSVFFALFIPVLLFLDGWRIPKEDLKRDIATVSSLAVGLVFFTVVILGYFIHLLIPSVPLPVAFALAAILSPTDPVAVSGITAKIPVPKKLMHILEGEALLNDASGLSAFRIAVAAMITGSFALHEAGQEFLLMAVGGAVTGALIAVIIVSAQNRVTRIIGEDSGSFILVSLLIPFGAYFGAEIFHFSGILAAATAGITMGAFEMRGTAQAVTRMRRTAVWDMVAMSSNGVIFVLLGEQLPGILDRAHVAAWEADTFSAVWLSGYVIAITVIMIAIRFIWVWINFRLLAFRPKGGQKMSWRLPAAATLAGVRGSVTLAGVMTLPIVIPGGGAFPARDLSIFLATGVIITTMITASAMLPFILRNIETPKDDVEERENAARVMAARAAMKAIEEGAQELSGGGKNADVTTEAASRAMLLYRERIDAAGYAPDAAEKAKMVSAQEIELRLSGLRAERQEILRLANSKRLPDDVARRIMSEIDLSEIRMTTQSAKKH